MLLPIAPTERCWSVDRGAESDERVVCVSDSVSVFLVEEVVLVLVEVAVVGVLLPAALSFPYLRKGILNLKCEDS